MKTLPEDDFLSGQSFGSPIRGNTPCKAATPAPRPAVERKISDTVFEVDGKFETRAPVPKMLAASDFDMLSRDCLKK